MGQRKGSGVGYRVSMLKIPLPPEDVLPQDGRFSAGPARIRRKQVEALCNAVELGTSHRADPVKERVRSVQEGLEALFSLPEGYEIVLGQGGATQFWPIIATSLASESVKAAVFGAFGNKAAKDVAAAPWLETEIVEAPAGQVAIIQDSSPEADVYMYAANETATGVVSPLYRGAPGSTESITVVDATSIAGAQTVDWSEVDAYYFSPQKVFGAEGGLWVSVLSPAAVARAESLANATDRYVPAMVNLAAAIKQSRAHQTVNTPSISTLILLDEQVRWMRDSGGLEAMAEKAARGAQLIQRWAEKKPYASLFVEVPQLRSPTVTTVDFVDEIPIREVARALREVGVYDIGGYGKMGGNQLRIPSFPNIETSDIEALLATLDWVIERL